MQPVFGRDKSPEGDLSLSNSERLGGCQVLTSDKIPNVKHGPFIPCHGFTLTGYLSFGIITIVSLFPLSRNFQDLNISRIDSPQFGSSAIL